MATCESTAAGESTSPVVRFDLTIGAKAAEGMFASLDAQCTAQNAEGEGLLDQVEMLAGQISGAKLVLAKVLARVEAEEAWKPMYPSFEEYANVRLNLQPGEAKKLVQVYRKLARTSVDLEQAAGLGYAKMAVVTGKMTVQNAHERVADCQQHDLHALRCKYHPGQMRVRQKETERQCRIQNGKWHSVYSRIFHSRPNSLEEIEDLPDLILPMGKNTGWAAHVSHLLFSSVPIRRAIRQAELATRLTGKQANLEYICLHFLKTFPGAGYLGLAVQKGDWPTERGAEDELRPDPGIMSRGETEEVVKSMIETGGKRPP